VHQQGDGAEIGSGNLVTIREPLLVLQVAEMEMLLRRPLQQRPNPVNQLNVSQVVFDSASNRSENEPPTCSLVEPKPLIA
jgi:hypothetical protein